MTTVAATNLRNLISDHRPAFDAALQRYGAKNPRLFGSAARGDANAESDIDILVDMDGDIGDVFLRTSGLSFLLNELLGVTVDVFPPQLLKTPISNSALVEAVAL